MIAPRCDKDVRDRLLAAYRVSRELGDRPPLCLDADLRALWIWSKMDFTSIAPDQLARVLILLNNLADTVDRYCASISTTAQVETWTRALSLNEAVRVALVSLMAAVDEAADSVQVDGGTYNDEVRCAPDAVCGGGQ